MQAETCSMRRKPSGDQLGENAPVREIHGQGAMVRSQQGHLDCTRRVRESRVCGASVE